jgi:hypothetical protein
MLCGACLGDGCKECSRGFIKQQARPYSLVTEEGADMFQAYCWFMNYGTLPTAGGLAQQSAAFVDAVNFCDSVHTAFARARDRRNEAVSKLQANLQKMMGNRAGRNG